ncbi:hypothetical protein [Armatimonas sp.]|uniref:hypothetical protein n=1 Tax=Armatimonas sp. TaxID=1872638 RepID=UPI00374D9374
MILVSGFTVTDLRPKSKHPIYIFSDFGALAMLQSSGKEELAPLGERLETYEKGWSVESYERQKTFLKPLVEQAKRSEIRLIVACDEPPPNKLGFVVVIGPGIPQYSILTSSSTRAQGIVTAADVAALVRGEPRAAYPVKTETGAWRPVWYWSERIEAIRAAKVAVLVTFGLMVECILAMALLLLRRPNPKANISQWLSVAAAGVFGLLLWSPLPLAAFDAPWFHVVGFLLITPAIAGLFSGQVKRVLLALVGLIFLDTIFGWKLVAQSPLSDYYIPGIRFYGIGNEYMGLLIGAALMGVPKKWLGGVGAGIVLLLGLPMLGANAGGAMAACVAFFPPLKGKRWRVLLPFLVVAALALLDRVQPGAAQSHIGQAAGKGASAWGEIIFRKLAMNARLTVAGPTLVAMVAVGVGGWQLKGLFTRLDEELQGRVLQGLWGAGAAIVFNDSGTVAALLLLAPVIVTCLDRALRLTESKVSSGILTPGAERL